MNIDEIYAKRTDKSLINDYNVYDAMFEIDGVEDTLLFDELVRLHNCLLDEAAERFVQSKHVTE